LFSIIEQLLDSVFYSNDKVSKRSFCKSVVYLVLPSSLNDLKASKFVLDRYYKSEDVETTYLLYSMLLEKRFRFFGAHIAPYVFGYIQKTFKSNLNECLAFCSLFGQYWDEVFPYLPLLFKDNGLVRFQLPETISVLDDNIHSTNFAQNLVEFIHQVDINGNTEESCKSLSLLCSATKIISRLSVPYKPVFDALTTKIISLIVVLETKTFDMDTQYFYGDRHALIKSILGHLISQLIKFTVACQMDAELLSFYHLFIKSAIAYSSSSMPLLCGIADYFESLESSVAQCIDNDFIKDFLTTLEVNIGSFDSKLRYQTIRIFSCFYVQTPNIFKLCIQNEEIVTGLDTIRQKAMILRKLEGVIQNSTDSFVIAMISRYTVSLYAQNFAPLWTEVTKTLKCCNDANSSIFWPILFAKFQTTSNGDIAAKTPSFNFKGVEIHISNTDKKNTKEVKNISFHCSNVDNMNESFSAALIEIENPIKYLGKMLETVCGMFNLEFKFGN
jgi:hypothetical protein